MSGRSSLLTQEQLNAQAQQIQTHFRENEAFTALWADLKGLHQEVVETFHQPELLPATLMRQAKAAKFLRMFIAKIHL